MNYLKTLIDLYRLKRQAKFTPKQMRTLQEKKLRKMLHHAWEHSAYYRRTFEAAGITEGQLDELPLSCFPTLNKKELLGHFDELVVPKDLRQRELSEFDAQKSPDRKPYKGKYHVVHSSGSTGKPGYFVYDEAAWSAMLLGMLRAALWDMSIPQILSLLAKRPRIAYIAATDGRYGGAMAVGDGIDQVGAKQIYLDIKTPLTEWIRQIKEFQPNIIIGYPSAVKILAELVEQGSVEVHAIRVISCGEPLGASLRSYLEKIFQSKVVNFYGASESLTMGVEMEPEDGMLLFDDMNLIEVESGVMYLTCLYNFAQPLIRYRISDSLTLKAAEENSPYPFTKACGLLGRNEDILWFEDFDGRREFLHPLAIEGFCIEGLLDYQFRQIAKDAFEMYAEASENADKTYIRTEMMGQMKKILAEKKLDYVQFYLIFVPEILPDPRTGKKPLILQKKEAVQDEKSVIAG
ncbi:AMP-binding protein [Lactonifactor sp. BIOML-A3]|uniref:phenylacetate--CoA ligase family protein n=1 Tax=unclassified Lactonifactor TaxID=2636670 RepID=UPI0012AF6C49|nr:MULTISPECIES: AMP-binding protein [unclassified Lactonifactor]MSA00927.1 AMP-binding protein [Lactonifactor sp. BIOML-A5]MSA07721.1 AMP-binding protein [Lactonifactor sp. BIOML-A4]MSA11917.1 AMP-binding protein [Lactonifactor sp. BIOML-A3]MSA16357.1 AMP-binding protein [Lactonifactor sp. BIOML-A2]MSA36961.1 AMP-binding protein [Lactonifactor sp. BIOML-A1]